MKLRDLIRVLGVNILILKSLYIHLFHLTQAGKKEKYGTAVRGNDARNRSKTFAGIAEAMAAQWGSIN